jgi:lipopolysaccharide/colanic/teichoic acid biosynthesis glycosyltransferase
MLKRIFDVTVSIVGLAALSPVLVVIAAAVAFGSPGPVFYRANRVGRNGVPFRLYKFRTMIADADKRGPGITTATDNRITPIGRILRRTKLDELPQLINVVRGDMSIVGPRPEDPRYVAYYTTQQRQVLSVRPGITSAASVKFRNESELLTGVDWERTYIETVMPEKLRIDLEYVQNTNLLHDLGIIARTVLALFR